MTTPSPQLPSAATVLQLLKQINHIVLGWAASLTWFRMFVLWILMLIAGSWISDRLDLRHGTREVDIPASRANSAKADEEILVFDDFEDCTNSEISIGKSKYKVVCEESPAVTPAGSASAASAPVTARKPTGTDRRDPKKKKR